MTGTNPKRETQNIIIREMPGPGQDEHGRPLFRISEVTQWLRLSVDEVQTAYLMGLFPNASLHLARGVTEINLRRESTLWDTLLVPDGDIDALMRKALPSMDVGAFVRRARQRSREEFERQRPALIAQGLLVEHSKPASTKTD